MDYGGIHPPNLTVEAEWLLDLLLQISCRVPGGAVGEGVDLNGIRPPNLTIEAESLLDLLQISCRVPGGAVGVGALPLIVHPSHMLQPVHNRGRR